MKFLIILFVTLILGGIAFADDPGERDSVIIETVYAELGDTAADVRIYVTCDDSVGFYNMPLAWNSAGDSSTGIYPVNISYYYPITHWDHVWDSILIAEQFIRMVGMTNGGDIDPPLITDNYRWHCWTLHFAIDSMATSQIVLIDSTYDPINGSLLFGLFGGVLELVPYFTPGAIYYGITSNAGADNRVLPEEIALPQNHPNPFNASTTIEFTLPEAAEVRLSVYNILGQKVAVIFAGIKQAGAHSVTWDAGDVPSGVYFARLESGDQTRAIKMVLLR
jgi:hypothetical protein